MSAAEELPLLLKAEQEWQLLHQPVDSAAAYFARDCVLNTKREVDSIDQKLIRVHSSRA